MGRGSKRVEVRDFYNEQDKELSYGSEIKDVGNGVTFRRNCKLFVFEKTINISHVHLSFLFIYDRCWGR